MPGRINGFTLAYAATGAIVLWSGIKGASISDTARDLLKGSLPATGTEPITPAPQPGTGSASGPAPLAGPASGEAAANQAIARLLTAPYGWSTGPEWDALVALWNRESGWSATATNPASGAYGIAQALGHGPTNQYPAGPANPPVSSATAQIAWGLSYIRQTYGSPTGAWEHEQSSGWY